MRMGSISVNGASAPRRRTSTCSCIDSNRNLWAADRGTNKILKYDLDGNFMYPWGTWGDFPGGMWGVHGLSIDQDGNFYVAEVDNGGAQKYRPRPGANPAGRQGRSPSVEIGTRSGASHRGAGLSPTQ